MRLLMGFRKPLAALDTALREAGCVLVPWQPGTLRPDLTEVDAVLLDFTEAARHLLSVLGLRWALGARVPIIGMDRDAPWYKGVRRLRLVFLASLRLLDIYASHSLQPGRRFAPVQLYLPNAAWLERYNLRGTSLADLRKPERYHYAVSFVGNVDAARYPEHRDRVRFLDALAERLARHGIKLEKFDSTAMDIETQVEVIQRSRINLNVGAAADNRSERCWGLPERCYGIAACGGFLLSDARRHARDDFVPGREWADFSNLDDCANKILDLLVHFDRLRDMAEAAHARVMVDHTYARRAQTLLAAIREWRQSREHS